MRALAFLLLFIVVAHAEEQPRDGMIPIAKFVISTPSSGTYAPWRDKKDQINYYAGELINIDGTSFRYVRFSDDLSHKMPDYSGTVSIFKDHVYLDHPGVPYPYRVAGTADGVPVLLTWEGYQQWKKTRKVFELNLLYLQKASKQKK